MSLPEEINVCSFADHQRVPNQFFDYPDTLRTSRVPLIIDNGSYECRVGWSSESSPMLVFRNLLAKSRNKKDSDVSIGNDIINPEVLRSQLKSQFDQNVVVNYDDQEQVFDYTFSHLGITSDGCVDHPIVMTEPFCNPNYCRQEMSELLFECYQVPRVCYGIDSLFSFSHNQPTLERKVSCGLIVSCGYHTVHLMPVLNGALQSQCCRRINVGGSHMEHYMQRILQLNYPGHFTAITLGRVEELLQNYCFISEDYFAEMELWAQEKYFVDNVLKFQLPHTQLPSNSTLSSEQKQDRKVQQVKRLREMRIKQKEEKLAADQEKLQQLVSVRELMEDSEDDFFRALEELGYANNEELTSAINKLNNAVQKLRNWLDDLDAQSENAGGMESGATEASKRSKAEGLAQKRIKTEKLLDIPDPPVEDEKAMSDWLKEIRKRHQDVLNKRTERRRLRSEMTKRKTLASQQRMKIITQLAHGTSKKKKEKKEDVFGLNDDDWNVYRSINKDGGETDSETEQEVLEELNELLREYDGEFKRQIQASVGIYDPVEYHRIYVGVERFRVSELLFQPSMIGIDQTGVAETIEFVLKKFSTEQQQQLAENVFLCGSCTKLPGFAKRLEREMRAIRPFQTTFNVNLAQDPSVDAWRGARDLAMLGEKRLAECSISRKDFEEFGGEYIKEHRESNHYFPTPGSGKQQIEGEVE